MKKMQLKYFLNIVYVVLIILGGLFLLDMIVFLSIYIATSDEYVLLAGTIVGFVIMGLLVATVLISSTLLFRVFYHGLFDTSRENLDRFINNKKVYAKYENKLKIKEFDELNAKLDDLEVRMQNTFISNAFDDYAHLSIKFLDSQYSICEYDSMAKNAKNLVLTARNYRDAFIELSYDIQDNEMSASNKESVIKAIKDNFDYKKLLIGITEDAKKFLIFIPSIDSISRLQEEVDNLLTASGAMNQSNDGLIISMAKVSAVIYPFSDIDEIMSDLVYASRQGRRVFFYMPNKLFMRGNDNQNHISLNVNNVSKILSMLSSLKFSKDVDEDKKIIHEALTHLIGFLNIDEAGVISYNQEIDRYRTSISAALTDDRIFKLEKQVSHSLISMFPHVVDEDGTYFFSNRKHANSEVGKFADIYGFDSGFFFLLEGTLRPDGLVYFVNRNSSMLLDSYNKEALLMISNLIHNASVNRRFKQEVITMNRRIDNYSKLSNLRLYTINKNTYEFISFSATMKDRNPDIDFGKKCFECIYHLNAPCKDCPLVTGKKKVYQEGNSIYETSMTMDQNTDAEADMLISLPNDNLSDHNRFDTEFLVNSFYSFLDRLKNLYLTRSKGYLITITIDNYRELYDQIGNEIYALMVRRFTQLAVDKIDTMKRMYLFHDNILVCVLPEMGRVDVVDTVESLYKFSKDAMKDTAYSDYSLNISYEAIRYPQTYDNEKDLMLYVDKYLITEKNHGTDMLHFEENDYLRPASRNAFILQTIENAVANNTFIMRMQPMVKVADKRIEGAEILIRLNDEQRNLMFNTFEMIKVAGDNNKIGIISDILINFIGDTYNKFGFTAFKQFGFNKISLNTEFSYFNDPNFLSNIDKMMKKYYFPKNFLGFEINERDLFDNYERFKSLSKAILSNGVYLVCDQYTGQYLSLERLKDVGITEIKVPRNIVKDIDINADKLNTVISIIEAANKQNVKTTLVGVENVDQYRLIQEQYKDVYMQGYYFYQPLDSNELIEALRKNNR